MPYCTLQQLIDRFGEPMLVAATDRAEVATGEIDEVAIDRAIADAQAVIDAYVGVKYALPLEEVPTIVVDVALTLTIYKLHPAVAGEKIATDYREAMKQLRDIADGKIKLGVAGIEATASGDGGVVTNEPERPFSAASMKSYI